MALTQVNRGTSPNDNTASTLYDAFGVVNTNFSNLSNVDNTTDLNKPISTATQTALNLKAPLASPTITGTLTTINDAIINSIRIGKGAGNIASNTVVGDTALNSNTSGFNNTGIGKSALASNTDGLSNTAVGVNSLLNNTTGDFNTAVGVNSLVNNQGGNNSSAFGYGALNSNITGINNSAFGANALTLTTVSDNTAFGTSVLFSNTTGNSNTAIGSTALYSNVGGDNNNAFGNSALINNVSGIQNVAIGSGSLYNSIIRNYNTAVGHQSLSSNTLYSNCVGLGSNAQVNGENQVQLGDAATTPYAYQALFNRSDLRDKTEVRDTVLGLDFINELRPVDYKWDMREDYKTEMPIQGELSNEDFQIVMDAWLESVKLDNITHDGTHTRTRYHHGLIAQEVQDIIEASGVDFGGFQDHSVNGGQDVLSIGYTELIAPMIKAIQELTARINALENN